MTDVGRLADCVVVDIQAKAWCVSCRYAGMDPEAIKLDRYAKFRKIGQYEEFLVRGGKWKEARKLRKEVRSVPFLLSCLVSVRPSSCLALQRAKRR